MERSRGTPRRPRRGHSVEIGARRRYYWSARFGGNVLGFVLRCGGNGVFAAWSDTWLVVLANVDDDWRWRDRGPPPRGFIARTRALLEKH